MRQKQGTKQKLRIKMLLYSLLRRKSRFLVAVLAIAIGASILSGLVTIYYDIPRQLGKEFRSYGANMLILPTQNHISEEEWKAFQELLPQNKVVGLAPYRYQTTNINEHPYVLVGSDLEEVKKNSPFWYIEGEWVEKGNHKQVMIGKQIASTMNLHVGDEVRVKGPKYGKKAEGSSIYEDSNAVSQRQEKSQAEESLTKNAYSRTYTIGGIITTGGAEESFVFMDIHELDALIESNFRIDVIEGSIEGDAQALEQLAKQIKTALPSLSARPVRRVTQSQDLVLNKLQALVYMVTLIVLVLTAISVATTMMAVVTERRKEIGLKKALGASNKDVAWEFVSESAMLGLLGGILGVGLGFIFAEQVSLSVFGRAVSFQLSLIPLTLFFSMLLAALACLFPVRSATKIEPALVLKGE